MPLSASRASGLPIIVDGRIRNYVFVTVKLYLGASQTPEAMRAKDAFSATLWYALAHRTPFVVPDDWTRVDEAAINRTLMAIAPSISGAGSVIRSEVLMQTPRRRTGVRQPKSSRSRKTTVASIRRIWHVSDAIPAGRTQASRLRTGGPEGGQRRKRPPRQGSERLRL